MSETKKQQVKINGVWQELLRLSDNGEFGGKRDCNRYHLIYRDKDGVAMFTCDDEPFTVRDTPAAPEPPKEVWVGIEVGNVIHLATSDDGARMLAGPGGITRRYDAPLPWKKCGNRTTIPIGEWAIVTHCGVYRFVMTVGSYAKFDSGDIAYVEWDKFAATLPKDE